MTLNNEPIENDDLPETFANFFKNKVNNIVQEQLIVDSVYNGKRKIVGADAHFMSVEKVIEAVNSMKNKNCEGYDRIP